jgi:hypothetical protein
MLRDADGERGALNGPFQFAGMSKFGYMSGDYEPNSLLSTSSGVASAFEASSSQLMLDRTAAAFLPPKTPIPLRNMPKT